MSWETKNTEFVKKAQRSLGVEADGKAGVYTNAAFDEWIQDMGIDNREWNRVTASSFADPRDVDRFEQCKAQGHSDGYCFRKGDNGIGAWGHNTAQEHTPMVALPRDDWKAAGKRGGAEVLLRYKGGPAHHVILGDTMPWKKNIENGAGIDLNPAALALFGLRAPVLKDGFEWTWA